MPKNQNLLSRRAPPHPQTQRPFPIDIPLRLRIQLELRTPLSNYFGSKHQKVLTIPIQGYGYCRNHLYYNFSNLATPTPLVVFQGIR